MLEAYLPSSTDAVKLFYISFKNVFCICCLIIQGRAVVPDEPDSHVANNSKFYDIYLMRTHEVQKQHVNR